MPATHPYTPRVSVLFDFDRTLATDTIDGLCATWGIGREEWERRYSDPLGDHWDGILKRGHALITCGQDRSEPLSDAFFDKAMQTIRLYDGVADLREKLESEAREILKEVTLELVILSSGFVEVIERTELKHLFDKIWAGGFHSDRETGEVIAVKRIIGHPEKALYIESHAKGLNLDRANSPQTEAPGYDPQDMHVPFDQMIYVGDGTSDLSSFEFLGQHGGLAIAVSKGEEFSEAAEQTAGERVENLAPPDYSPAGEMLESLCHAVRSAASRAALRKLGSGE